MDGTHSPRFGLVTTGVLKAEDDVATTIPLFSSLPAWTSDHRGALLYVMDGGVAKPYFGAEASFKQVPFLGTGEAMEVFAASTDTDASTTGTTAVDVIDQTFALPSGTWTCLVGGSAAGRVANHASARAQIKLIDPDDSGWHDVARGGSLAGSTGSGTSHSHGLSGQVNDTSLGSHQHDVTLGQTAAAGGHDHAVTGDTGSANSAHGHPAGTLKDSGGGNVTGNAGDGGAGHTHDDGTLATSTRADHQHGPGNLTTANTTIGSHTHNMGGTATLAVGDESSHTHSVAAVDTPGGGSLTLWRKVTGRTGSLRVRMQLRSDTAGATVSALAASVSVVAYRTG